MAGAVALLASSTLCASATAQIAHEIDIIPTPKLVEMTGETVPLTGEARPVLLLGDSACRQSRIGADWINGRIEHLRGPALAVMTDDTGRPKSWTLVVGTVEDSALIREAVGRGAIDVGNGNPGERGYEIKVSREAKRVYLAGADGIGALYACVTLGQMIRHDGTSPVLHTGNVRDWPDVIHAMQSSNTGWGGLVGLPEIWKLRAKHKLSLKETQELSSEAYQEILAACQSNIDRLLAHKIAMIRYNVPYEIKDKDLFRLDELKRYEVFREAIAYANERGIGVMGSGFRPFVGLKKYYPEHAELSLPSSRSYKDWIRCWGLDDCRRKTAANVAEFAKHMGLTDIWFHDSDQGFYFNPAQWDERNEQDRERWGDDYAAALINKLTIYVEELRKLSPEIRIHFTVVPYGCNIMDVKAGADIMQWAYGDHPEMMKLADEMHAKYVPFFRKVGTAFPKGVYLQIREADGVARQKFNELLDNRPINTWFATNPLWPFFSPSPSMLKEVCNNVHSVVKPAYCDNFVPLNTLAVREYTWDTKTPGMQSWKYSFGFDHDLITDFLARDFRDEPIYRVVLPRIARALFGRELASDVAEALSQQLVHKTVFGYARFRFVRDASDTSAFMKRQAAYATTGVQALDGAWGKLQADPNKLWLKPHQVRYLVYLREVFHASMWMAQLKYHHRLARELATEHGDEDGAKAAAQQGLAVVDEALADMGRLVAERPTDPLLETYVATDRRRNAKPGSPAHRRWEKVRYSVWFGLLASGMDFYYIKGELTGMLKNIPALARIKEIPESVLSSLRQQPVYAFRAQEPIHADGLLDEPTWGKSYPRESFFVLKSKGRPKIALADTRAMLLYDDDHLHVAAECRVPEGGPLSGSDMVELFIQNPTQGGDYVHFTVPTSGKARHQHRALRKDEHGFTAYRTDNNWKCPGFECTTKKLADEGKWTAEISIPLAGIGGGPLTEGFRVNWARNCNIRGLCELSSIQDMGATSFHDVDHFRRVSLKGDIPFVREVSLLAPELKHAEVTRTTGIATVASFRIRVQANLVLHNVSIAAEARTASGDLEGKCRLGDLPSVTYSWDSPKTSEVPFQNVVKGGRVKIVLTSAEAREEAVFALTE